MALGGDVGGRSRGCSPLRAFGGASLRLGAPCLAAVVGGGVGSGFAGCAAAAGDLLDASSRGGDAVGMAATVVTVGGADGLGGGTACGDEGLGGGTACGDEGLGGGTACGDEGLGGGTACGADGLGGGT